MDIPADRHFGSSPESSVIPSNNASRFIAPCWLLDFYFLRAGEVGQSVCTREAAEKEDRMLPTSVLGVKCLLRPSAGKVDRVHEPRGGREHEPSGESTP
jgi:hypothetical protein